LRRLHRFENGRDRTFHLGIVLHAVAARLLLADGEHFENDILAVGRFLVRLDLADQRAGPLLVLRRVEHAAQQHAHHQAARSQHLPGWGGLFEVLDVGGGGGGGGGWQNENTSPLTTRHSLFPPPLRRRIISWALPQV